MKIKEPSLIVLTTPKLMIIEQINESLALYQRTSGDLFTYFVRPIHTVNDPSNRESIGCRVDTEGEADVNAMAAAIADQLRNLSIYSFSILKMGSLVAGEEYERLECGGTYATRHEALKALLFKEYGGGRQTEADTD